MEKNNYDISTIKVLSGIEGVRKRPAMYIGNTGKEGLHHLVFEVVDNSVDEHLAGFCTEIKVILKQDGSVVVEDNGRGIPVEVHPLYKKTGLELVMTTLHAGSKFDHKAYSIAGGLHGVGVSVVNALSEWMIVRVKRNGNVYEQKYARGKALGPVKVVGKGSGTGTFVHFKPDGTVFSSLKFDFDLLSTRLRELAFLNPGLTIALEQEGKRKESFKAKGGLIEFIGWLNRGKKVLHKPIYFSQNQNNLKVQVALQYNDSYHERIFGFVNTINTIEGGTHVIGFKKALTRAVSAYALKNKSKIKIEGEDVREGLTAIISVYMSEPQFEGQTKTKLGNSEVQGVVDSIVFQSLSQFFEENPSVARAIIGKVSEAAKAREAAKHAKELVRRKSLLASGTLPGKLADCSSRKVELTELYLVEGDSAAGSSKQARNKEFQAILPLRGKILNVEKASSAKIFSSKEISEIIQAVGTGVSEHFQPEKLRYGKIIIMTDADVDGSHIKTLLLTFFFRFMPQLIEQGRIFVAKAPLYRVRKGNQDYYVYSDQQLKKISGEKSEVQRFKGLGEMNPQQLWQTTMNPKTRVLKQITIQDAIEADRLFSVLMGEEVEPRKKFILEHAQEAFLDI